MNIYRFAGKGGWALLIGATSDFFELHQLEIQEGRFISALDQKQPHVVVAQKVLARAGFKDFKGPLLGSQVKINQHIYTIIGVLEDVPEPLFALTTGLLSCR